MRTIISYGQIGRVLWQVDRRQIELVNMDTKRRPFC